MKNPHNSKNAQNLEDELLPEYDFDYNQARPNRFAASDHENSVRVTLAPDVAKVFKTSEEVNQALRSLLSAIPENHRISIQNKK